MARMIPPVFPEQSSPGEQSVYRALAEDTTTDDWIVLHSLNIAEHVRNPEGEADFVVIAPELGILVIEVKSHDHFTFEDGVWRLGMQPATTRGPFKQASEAIHSIRNELERKKINLRSTPMISAAWFTHTRARTLLKSSSEWHDWQVLDSGDLKNSPIGAVRRAFSGGIAHLDDTFPNFSYGGVGPDAATAKQIAMVLRPNFEFGLVAGDIRSARDGQLIRFTAEQFMALDAMSDNVRVLFTGPAGSGKTFLAMEAARRELAQGKRGRLICFNKLLGRRLSQDMGSGDGLVVGTFHRQLLDITGRTAPNDATSDFWELVLPERAAEVLMDSGPIADFLVIDEVQDLLSGTNLDVLELMVQGGLSEGRVLMFGDFERQAIFDDGRGRENLAARIPHLTSFRLTKNCRNLPRIGFSVNILSGLNPGYQPQDFRRVDDGANPVWFKYQRGSGQSALLREAVEALREEHFDLNEIVVLSPMSAGSTAATTPDPWLRSVLEPADGSAPRKGRIRYSSIQAFKGLEAPAVIVTDLDRSAVPNFESVLYVGLTRATDRLCGVIEDSTGLAGVAGKL